MSLARLSLVATSATLVACAVEGDKAHYSLTDSQTLHTYQPGEYLYYQFVGDAGGVGENTSFVSGEVRIVWEAAVLPNASIEDPGFLKETTDTSFSDGRRKITMRYVAQDNDGNLNAYAYEDEEALYWLTPDGGTFGLRVMFSPLDLAAPSLGGSINLQECEPTCTQTAGSFSVGLLDGAVPVETVSTPKGEFEAYRVTFSSLLDMPANIGTTTTYERSQITAWIYPPVGIVKFVVQMIDEANVSYYYTASLYRTNIDLPEPDQ